MAGRFSIETIFSGKDYLSRVMDRMQRRMKKFEGATASFSKINERLLNSVNGLAVKGLKAGAALGTAGLAAGLLASTKAGMDFDQAITNVGAVSLMTRDQIADLEAKALALGQTTKFSATEAANAMEMMAEAGFTNSQIIEGIDGVLSAAAAEGIGLEETASHVSNVLKGMGLDNEKMGQNAVRVADVLALASARTNSSIGSLGESMANVSATARELRVPLEDTVAAVAMLQDVGLDASVAGSALNTMLTQMAAPTAEVAAKMKRWGISFKDAKGDMLPFQDVLANISKAADKAGGNFDQVAFFAELVGLRGQKAASNLGALFNSGKFQALTEELTKAAGSAGKMASIRMDTLRGDLTLLKSSAEGVAIGLFDLESGPLRGVVQQTTNWLNANRELIKTKVAEYIADFAKALPEILYYGKKIAIGAVTFYGLSTGVRAATGAIKLMNAVTAGGFWGSNKTTIMIYGTLTALSLLVAYWPEIKKFWQDNKYGIEAVGTALGVFYAALNVEKISNFASGAVGALKSFSAGGIAAIDPLHQKIIAMGAALAAVQWALAENDKLQKQNEGQGIFDIMGEMARQGTLNPFKAIDTLQNETALVRYYEGTNARLAEAEGILQGGGEGPQPQVLTPNQGPEAGDVGGEITIRDETGRASFTKPTTGPISLKLRRSGGY
jgi:TP901 family phage tail tape measure protein